MNCRAAMDHGLKTALETDTSVAFIYLWLSYML